MSTKTLSPAARVLMALAVVLMAGLVAAAAFVAPAQATKGDAYTYTVRVWAGNHGTVNGSSELATIDGIKYGEVVKLSDKFNVKVVNSKDKTQTQYYVKGFRLSGTDNQKENGSTNLRASVTVTEDTDFVVAYGVKGKMVGYTVRFVERGTGKTLADEVTYEGMPGDKPVVAYEFVRGYRPLYRNITKTLSADESKNVFTFEYVKLAAGQSESGQQTPTPTPRPTPSSSTTAGTGTTPGGTTPGGTTPGGATTPTTPTTPTPGGTNAQTQTPNVDENGNPPTEEIRDEDTPLASTTSTDTETDEAGQNAGGIPFAAMIAGLVALLAAAIAIILFLLKRRQNEEQYE